MTEPYSDDYDGPWKEAIETYFREFIEFFFPLAAQAIDWQRGHEFLDQEFRQIMREAETPRRVVDKLARVWLQGGEETWVLTHVEVQNQRDGDFEERMFMCNYRIYDLYRRRVATLVVLGDEQAGWRPSHYGYELWGCRMEFAFPTVKLLDLRARQAELETSINPFAHVVLAHLATQQTRGDNQRRSAVKIRLVKMLYERDYTAEQIRGLFKFIDWLLFLPAELQQGFRQELQTIEVEKQMPYVTSIERLALEEGMEKGMEKGARNYLLLILQARFGTVPESLVNHLSSLTLSQLQACSAHAVAAPTLDEFAYHLPPVTAAL